MASPRRRGPRDLIAEIGHDGPHFRFFQAVRLLSLADPNPDNSAQPPRQLRFGTPLSLSFPASEILAVNRPEVPAVPPSDVPAREGEPVEEASPSPAPTAMTVGFMGLTGPSGALPTAYTELLIARRNEYRDSTAHHFLDLFSHRSIALFYQAWRKSRFYLAFEAGDSNGFARNILDIVGVGLKHLRQRLEAGQHGIPDTFLTHFAGLLSQHPIPSVNIAALVRGYFGVPAALEQFVGQWIALPPGEQTRLGRQSSELGCSTFLGERLWDRQTKLRLRLGPLTGEQYANLLPGRPGLDALQELIHFCLGHAHACDVNLVLRKEDRPPPEIRPDQPPRLGFNLWLGAKPPAADLDDACFSLLK